MTEVDAKGALAGMGALVTGGAGGMGSAAARWLVRDGAAVTLMGRTEKTLAGAAAELSTEAGFGGSAQFVVGDAMNRHDLLRAIDAASAVTGRLNICIATLGGGVGGIGPLLALHEDRFVELLDRNLVSAFMAIKYSTPAISASGGGSVVCLSSIVARLSWPYQAALSAAKAGLEGLVRVAADELGPLHVRINAVRPGLTRTPRAAGGRSFKPDMLARFVEQMPLGRAGEPGDVAAAIRFLAGPESSWITGQSIAVDGGHELRRAPDFELLARELIGDEAVDASLSGKLAHSRAES